MNHEAITPAYLHPTGPTIVGGVRTVADEVLKEFYVHGVSVIEIRREAAQTANWAASQAAGRAPAMTGTTSSARASIVASTR